VPDPGAVLRLSDAMRRHVDRYVPRDAAAPLRARALAQSILHPGLLGLSYDVSATLTAAEAFDARRGNCLSLSMLYAVMARYAGLEARFQEVESIGGWDRRGEVVLATRHINVVGEVGAGRSWVMDFYPYRVDAHVREDVVPDRIAVAQYYNNLGGEALSRGEAGEAWHWFRAALDTAPDLSYVWSNLGVVYAREGAGDVAERVYRHALAIDPDNRSAMSNLAALYARTGRTEAARELAARIERYARRNPYYHLSLAEDAFDRGDAEAALRSLETAVELAPGEADAHWLAAVALRRLGRYDEAEAALARARSLAPDGPSLAARALLERIDEPRADGETEGEPK
jgi:Flp pilus assembly protein TadD